MLAVERRRSFDRRRVPRGGRRATDRPGHHPAVLVADHYDSARQPCARYLAAFHFDVLQAADGGQAINYVTAAGPSVILVEWALPAMPAARLYQWLAENGHTRDIPIIVLMGAYDGSAPIPPVAAILLKPFPLASMLEEIRRALRSSARRTA